MQFNFYSFAIFNKLLRNWGKIIELFVCWTHNGLKIRGNSNFPSIFQKLMKKNFVNNRKLFYGYNKVFSSLFMEKGIIML